MKNQELVYQTGFGNEFTTEAESGALPKKQNSPQKCPLGLYAEQLNGTAFTAPQKENKRSWFYRIKPSVCQKPFERVEQNQFLTELATTPATPNQLRWNPIENSTEKTNFIQGMKTFCLSGNASSFSGSAIHLFAINESMTEEYFYNSDGELLIVLQSGELLIKTECGDLQLSPLEIALIPRGIKFQVQLSSESARGYVCENFGLPFTTPDRGPIGANGLAAARDFQSPVAKYEDKEGGFKLYTKFQDHLWVSEIDHSPLNVVAWHGNYTPYKYDLNSFQVINTVSFDHPDPSIFTVLTSPSGHAGTANLDFVIFPPRWIVGQDTFRPPYYHRNVMSEYMGLLCGEYDAKSGGNDGFVPGGGSLHNCMTSHGPDTATFEKASAEKLEPKFLKDTMAFMFESKTVYKPTNLALNSKSLQPNYYECWQGLKNNFSK